MSNWIDQPTISSRYEAMRSEIIIPKDHHWDDVLKPLPNKPRHRFKNDVGVFKKKANK